jgi:hypothetical protein
VTEPRNNWLFAIRQKSYRFQLIVVVAALLAILLYLPTYFHTVIGPREGVLLNDFVLNAFTPGDYSWLIFLLIYFSLALVLQGAFKQPYTILFALKCYLAITLFRMITMFLFTLEPPMGIVILKDPLIDKMAYGGTVFTKDLFFSGHIATLTMLVWVERRRWAKWSIAACTGGVALLLMMQRVHYTIDILFAPLAASLVVLLIKRYTSQFID